MFKEGNRIIYPLTIDVINQDKWTLEQVEINQEKYLNNLINIWNLDNTANKVYWHNIGHNDDVWWSYLKTNNVITAGFEGKAGDQGEKILTSYRKGDRIIAYASGYGAIGWGIIKEYPTYRLIEPGSAEDIRNGDHMHRLNINWQCVADKIGDAISATDILNNFAIHHPVSTSVRLTDIEKAQLLIQELEDKFKKK